MNELQLAKDFWNKTSRLFGLEDVPEAENVLNAYNRNLKDPVLVLTKYKSAEFLTVVKGGCVTRMQSIDSMRFVNFPKDAEEIRYALDNMIKIYESYKADEKSHMIQALPHDTFDGIKTVEDVNG